MTDIKKNLIQAAQKTLAMRRAAKDLEPFNVSRALADRGVPLNDFGPELQ